ncbi:MAG: hypothetical protein JWQ98_1941 [Chlorobi bacterium]|nr:hypothetical protein [Chlorobiota bacterium]
MLGMIAGPGPQSSRGSLGGYSREEISAASTQPHGSGGTISAAPAVVQFADALPPTVRTLGTIVTHVLLPLWLVSVILVFLDPEKSTIDIGPRPRRLFHRRTYLFHSVLLI